MLADAVEYLACPLCGTALTLAERMLRCARGHSFDVARHGYASLLPGDVHAGTADTAAMVAARDEFLRAGHFAVIAQAVAEEAVAATTTAAAGGCVVDVGAGTGYYLAATLDRLPDRVGLALDLSRYALRRAARAHPRIAALRCDAWRALPVRDGCAAAVLTVFAPRQPAEIRRILRPDGAFILVTPTARHLAELVAPLGLLTVDERKPERLAEQFGATLMLADQHAIDTEVTLARADVAGVAAMGPSAWHTDPAMLAERISKLPDRKTVTVSVTISTYRPKATSGGAE